MMWRISCALGCISLAAWSWGFGGDTTSSTSTSSLHSTSISTPACTLRSDTSDTTPSPDSFWFSLLKDLGFWEHVMEWVNSSSTDFASLGGQVITYIFHVWSEAQPIPEKDDGLDGAYMDYHAYYGYYGAFEGYYEGDNDFEAGGYYEDEWFYYHYYYLDYYMGKYGGYSSAPSTTTPPSPSASMWSVLKQVTCLLMTCCFCARSRAIIPRMVGVLLACFRASRFGRLLSQCVAALACDSRAIARALVRCAGDIALVLMARSPRAIRHLRGPILRFRSMLDLELTDEDEVLVRDGDSYKPLLMIQQGGRRARWGGSRRWSQIRSRAFRTRYSPTAAGDCLFSSFRFVAQRSGCGSWSVKTLRKMVQWELERISSSSELVYGCKLSYWAGQLNMTEEAFITNCTGPHRRWGNTLDLFVLANLFGVNLRAIDTKTGSSLMFHRAHAGAVWSIGLANKHFTVLQRYYHEGTLRSAAEDGLIAQGGMQGTHTEEAHDGCIIVDPLLDTCVLDGSTQILGNEEQLRELCTAFHDLDEEAGSPRPEPVDWLQLEDEWSRTWLLADLREFLLCFRVFSLWAFPRARQWKQYIRTPPQFSISEGGMQSTCRTGPYATSSLSCSSCLSSGRASGHWYSSSSLAWPEAGGRLFFFVFLFRTAWHGQYSFASCKRSEQGAVIEPCRFELKCGGTNTSMPPPPVPPRRRVETQATPKPLGVAKVAKVVDARKPPVKAKAKQQPKHGSAAASPGKATPQVDGGAAAAKAQAKVPTPPHPQAPPQQAAGLQQRVEVPKGRPYPFSPLFKNVQAFPPAKLGEIIELTASYAFEFPVRSVFEQGILADSDGGERFSFLLADDLYHPYYQAVLCWIQARKDRDAQLEDERQAASTASSSAATSQRPGPPMEAKAKPVQAPPAHKQAPVPASKKRPSLEAAVAAVNKRRRAVEPVDDRGITVDTDSDDTSSHPSCQMVTTLAPQPEGQPDRKPPPPRPDREDRPALPRRRPEHTPQEKRMPRPRIVLVEAAQDPWQPYLQPWASDDRASHGTLKLTCPMSTCVNHFARTVITPLAALLDVKVLSVGRRSGEQEVRVLYRRDQQYKLPVVAASVVESIDILRALGSVKAMCHHLYMESRVRADNVDQILNSWSDAGRLAQTALLMVIRGAILHTMQSTMMIRPVNALLVHQANHLTVVVLPLTRHNPEEMARELQQHFHDYLDRNAVRAENREWNLQVQFKLRQGAGKQSVTVNFGAKGIGMVATGTDLPGAHIMTVASYSLSTWNVSTVVCLFVKKYLAWTDNHSRDSSGVLDGPSLSALCPTPLAHLVMVNYGVLADSSMMTLRSTPAVFVIKADSDCGQCIEQVVGSEVTLVAHLLSIGEGGTKSPSRRSSRHQTRPRPLPHVCDKGSSLRPPVLTSPSLTWSTTCPFERPGAFSHRDVDDIASEERGTFDHHRVASAQRQCNAIGQTAMVDGSRTHNHIRAFCSAATALHLSITCQDAVHGIEKFVRQQTQLGFCGKLLKDALAAVRHVPTAFWPGTGVQDLFLKSALLDLTILSMLHGISVTVTDSKDKYPLQVLQRPGSDWTLLRLGQQQDYDVLAVMHSSGTTLRHIDIDLEQDDPTWDNRMLEKVADLLFSQDIVLEEAVPSPSQSVSASVSPPSISETEPAPCDLALPVREGKSAVTLSDTPASLLIKSGAGKTSRAASSSTAAPQGERPDLMSEDELPLTALLETAQDTAKAESDAMDDAAQQPMVVFVGMFHNGRTQYRQVLWPAMRWADAQTELNRDVRRRKCLWCMCVNETPVDPTAIVPVAQTPFDTIRGTLRRLAEPLDYDQLRGTGGLCAPSRPTHVGRDNTPTAEAAAPADNVPARLVDAAYDSDSSLTCERRSLPIDVTSSDGGGSDTSSLVPCIDLSSHSDTDGSSDLDIRDGGGKYKRVQHEAIAEAALSRMLADLSATPQGLLIEHKCVSRILHSDPRAAKAIFQGQTSCQRYEAFAAALARAGLTDFSRGIAAAIANLKGRQDHGAAPTDRVPENGATVMPDAISDPYLVLAEHTKKRGRPRRDGGSVNAKKSDTTADLHTKQARPTSASAATEREESLPPPVQPSQELRAIITKIEQLEQWAHGVDGTLAKLPKPLSPSQKAAKSAVDEIPPTIDYDSQEGQSSVPQRIVEYERLVHAQSDAAHASLAHSRLTRLESTLQDLTTRFVDDPAVMFKQLTEDVDRLNTFATEASVQLQRSCIYRVGEDLPAHLANEQEPEKYLGWRIHMIEKTIQDHVDTVQGVHGKYLAEMKEMQGCLQRLQHEHEVIKKQSAKQTQLLNVVIPWISNLASKVQEPVAPALNLQHFAQLQAAQTFQHTMPFHGMQAFGGHPQHGQWPQWPQAQMFQVPTPPFRQVAPMSPMLPTPSSGHGMGGLGPH
eukprot:6471239-Amphidinium_carterae.3